MYVWLALYLNSCVAGREVGAVMDETCTAAAIHWSRTLLNPLVLHRHPATGSKQELRRLFRSNCVTIFHCERGTHWYNNYTRWFLQHSSGLGAGPRVGLNSGDLDGRVSSAGRSEGGSAGGSSAGGSGGRSDSLMGGDSGIEAGRAGGDHSTERQSTQSQADSRLEGGDSDGLRWAGPGVSAYEIPYGFLYEPWYIGHRWAGWQGRRELNERLDELVKWCL